MSSFHHAFEVVDRGNEIQLKVDGKKKLILYRRGLLGFAYYKALISVFSSYPGKMISRANFTLMLSQRLRRWSNMEIDVLFTQPKVITDLFVMKKIYGSPHVYTTGLIM